MNTIEVDGHTLLLDAVGSGQYTLQYEGYEMSLFKESIKKGDTVVDIGAHIGCYTVLAAERAGPEGRVIAFEPDPKTFDVLKENVKNSGFENVVLDNRAVSNKSGSEYLYLCQGNTLDNRIIDWQDGWSFIEVESIRLDDYLWETGISVDILKMDIQGAEPLALEGMAETIRNSRALTIFSELWPKALKILGVSPETYIDMLRKRDFNVWEISEKVGALLSIDINNYLALFEQSQWYTNLLAKKQGGNDGYQCDTH